MSAVVTENALNGYQKRKADRDTSIRVIGDLIARENVTQQWLAGPLLRESQDKVKKLLAAYDVLKDEWV